MTKLIIQTTEGRAVGTLDSLDYSMSRVTPIYSMGAREFNIKAIAVAGSFTLCRPLDGEWLISRSATGIFEQVEPLEIIIRTDDNSETQITITYCEIMKEGYGVSYRDLIGLTGGFTFIASNIIYMASEETLNVNMNTIIGYGYPKPNTHPGNFVVPTSDDIVCAQPLTRSPCKTIFQMEYDVKWIGQDLLKEEEDPHKGMIYNSYTDKWSFL